MKHEWTRLCEDWGDECENCQRVCCFTHRREIWVITIKDYTRFCSSLRDVWRTTISWENVLEETKWAKTVTYVWQRPDSVIQHKTHTPYMNTVVAASWFGLVKLMESWSWSRTRSLNTFYQWGSGQSQSPDPNMVDSWVSFCFGSVLITVHLQLWVKTVAKFSFTIIKAVKGASGELWKRISPLRFMLTANLRRVNDNNRFEGETNYEAQKGFVLCISMLYPPLTAQDPAPGRSVEQSRIPVRTSQTEWETVSCQSASNASCIKSSYCC